VRKAVVLMSGGIDSTTTLAIVSNDGYEVYALSFDYNQRHRIEIEMARRNAARFRVKEHLILSIDLKEIAPSALTANIEVPKDRAVDQKDRRAGPLNPESDHPPVPRFTDSLIPVTYVPARNVIFLSFALAFAETRGIGDIFIGANAVDYSGYPDCRPEFIKSFEEMANLAMKSAVEGRSRFKIHAPLIGMSKSAIIKKGVDLGVDFSDTWSCYDPQPLGSRFRIQDSGFNALPCGGCDSCFFRAKGFREAGMEDPLILKVKDQA